MSIALDSGSNRSEGSRFIGGMSCIPIFETPEPGRSLAGVLPVEGRFPVDNMAKPVMKVEQREELDSCSSSIGRNSDVSERSSDGEDSGENEAQSSYKGPLDTMDALEEVLPMRRGISKFYCGKSKSFATLADATASSIKDLAKPENAYTRKRKNLLACTNFLDKNRNFPLRLNGGGISKRPTNSSRSTLAIAVAMNSSESEKSSESSNSNSSSPPRLLPPLHPQLKPPPVTHAPSSPPPRRNFSSWRSFSLTDLQCAAASTTTTTTSSSICNIDMQ